MEDLAQALAVAVSCAREAGALLRNDFYRPGGARGSGSHAEADEEAEHLIRRRLLDSFLWNYRGEETGTVLDRDPRHCWLVDPNDGTSSYLKGYRGSAVSIGLLRDGVPVLGVVFAFAYPDDDGDLIAWAEGCPLSRNGVPLQTNLIGQRLDSEANPRPIVFLSQDADRKSVANAACVRPARYIALPSIAYRLARAAAGDGVAAVSLSGPCSWDYGAGHALLRGAGGVLVDQSGKEVVYTADGQSAVHACFGGSPAVVQELWQRDWQQATQKTSPPSPPFCLVRPQRGHAIGDRTMLARAQGCLLGQLAGDALGGLVEFRKPESIRADYPGGVRELRDGGTWSNLAGQPTDDSEMALMLARTLVHLGSYDSGAVLDAYCHWWPEAWDRGGTLRQALSAATPGKTTAERLRLAAANANSSRQSNGSLMRISPLGIFGAGRPERAADWARQDSRLTHPNPVCQDACAVFVAAIATAIGSGATAEECYAAALAEADRGSARDNVRPALERARLGPPTDFTTEQGWVLIALQNAFYQLLHAPTVEDGLVDTVMHGGDTDTTAAIAGTLLGAVHGRAGLPARWILTVQSCRAQPPAEPGRNHHPRPEEFWPVDALELAEALLWAGRQPARAS